MSPAGHPDEPVLSARDLTLQRRRREILRGVDLDLWRGEIVALLGPNGAGKSTLLDALAGGLPAAGGEVQRRGRVALALQVPDLARRTVLANVTLALSWWGVRRPEREPRARRALAALGVEELADRPALELSGGERRRVHLARALAVEPDVLMLDEPFAGLDPDARTLLLRDASIILRDPERATLVVVHDRAEAWALADRLIVLLAGRVAATGTPRTLLEAPPTVEVARFLGYDGELLDGDARRLTRAGDVAVDAQAARRGRVLAVIPNEDGARVELELTGGRVHALVSGPPPRVGETVGVRVDRSVRFAEASSDQAAAPAEPAPTTGSGSRRR